MNHVVRNKSSRALQMEHLVQSYLKRRLVHGGDHRDRHLYYRFLCQLVIRNLRLRTHYYDAKVFTTLESYRPLVDNDFAESHTNKLKSRGRCIH